MTSRYLHGPRIEPKPITNATTLVELVESSFQAYNAARLREACMLLSAKMLADDVTIGMSLTGALTPAGLGISAIIPLIEAGFVDWIVSTLSPIRAAASSTSLTTRESSATSIA